jgi:thiamine-phosphate pyrophosphorylase
MSTDEKLFRILDANANRAREGLRVVEEHLRLVCDHASLTDRTKKLRHAITDAIIGLGAHERLIMARQSETDVGAQAPTESEGRRTDTAHIVTANLRRAQEGLRVLEEYSKLLSSDTAADFKRLRFETYTLEKDILLHMR